MKIRCGAMIMGNTAYVQNADNQDASGLTRTVACCHLTTSIGRVTSMALTANLESIFGCFGVFLF